MPDILNPEHDETKEFYVYSDESELSQLSEHLPIIAELFSERVERVDFYISPMTNSHTNIQQFIRNDIIAELCKKR